MSNEPVEYVCPNCGGAVLIAQADIEQVAVCPTCQQEVTIPASAEPAAPAGSDVDELDHVRITQRATLQRALYRSRSYAIIAAVVCAVAIVQLALSGYHAIKSNAFAWAGGYFVLMIGAVVGAIYFYRRAMALHQEGRQSRASVEPQVAPDFTPLSDGSQRWNNLHDVRDD